MPISAGKYREGSWTWRPQDGLTTNGAIVSGLVTCSPEELSPASYTLYELLSERSMHKNKSLRFGVHSFHVLSLTMTS